MKYTPFNLKIVFTQNFQEIINETLRNIPSGSLTLPSSKRYFLKLNIENSISSCTVYSAQKPCLPFARSEEFQACIKNWRRLTSPQSPYKPIYEIDLDIRGSNFSFKPGDTISIIPKNNEFEVDKIINHLGLQSIMNCQYNLCIEEGQKGKVPVHIPVSSNIKYVLTNCVDLRGVVKKLFLLDLSRHTKEESERNMLEFLCSKEGSTIYKSHVLDKNICLMDIFNMFQSCKPPIEVLFEHLPRLLPRPYSIVNSQYREANIIKICFSVMVTGTHRKGLTTGWLEENILSDTLDKKMDDLRLNKNINVSKIPIYLRQNVNGFTLPEDPKKPIILIGIGSGVSPFIGFLEEREHMKSKLSINIGIAWLFFGCRNPDLDYIYEKQLNIFLENGILSKLCTAFSRLDDCENKYVQDAILKNEADMIKLIKEGAIVYICGDVKIMATQVKETLVKCVIRHENWSEKEAENYISDMQKERRLLVDVWN